MRRNIKPFQGMYRRWFARLEWKPQDLWVGVFWKRDHPSSLDVWVCIVPMVPLHFGWRAVINFDRPMAAGSRKETLTFDSGTNG